MDSDKESNVEQEIENIEVEKSAEVSPPTPQVEPSLVPEEVVQKLQSERQRYKNMYDAANMELEERTQLLAQLQSEQRKSLLAEFGDNPTVQDLIKKLEQSELSAAKLATREKRVLHMEKVVDAQELAEKYGCKPNDLMEAQSFAEMEGMAKVLGKTKTVPQIPGTPKKQPAIPHIPDSGVSSARRPSDFETVEDAYAKGDISFKEYQEERKKKGLS